MADEMCNRQDCVAVVLDLGVVINRVDLHFAKHRARSYICRWSHFDLTAFLSMPFEKDSKSHRKHRMNRKPKLATVDIQAFRQLVTQRKVVPPASIRAAFLTNLSYSTPSSQPRPELGGTAVVFTQISL